MLYPLSYGGDGTDATNVQAKPGLQPTSALAGPRCSIQKAPRGLM